jgi:hypothetical protein
MVSALVGKVVPKGKANGEVAPVPFYKQAFVSGIGGQKERQVTTSNGESDNFICNIMLPVDADEAALLQSGTRFVCRLPPQMV